MWNCFVRGTLSGGCLLLFSLCSAQGEWKLRSEKNGIRSYTQSTADSHIKSIRLEAVFSVSLAKLVAVIADARNYDEWVYNSRSTRIVQQVSPYELYYYSELVFPWPAANRDFVSHVRISQDPKNKAVSIIASNISGWEPLHPKIIRMTFGEGHWELVPLSKNEVSVTYLLKADPGGDLPAWIVNSFSSQGPQASFENLRRYLLKAGAPDFPLPYPVE